MLIQIRHILAQLFVTAAVITLAACAGTAPKASYVKGQAIQSPVNASDHVQVTVEAGAGVTILDYEKTRLVEQLKSHINSTRAQNVSQTAARDLMVTTTVTRYQKGSAFARAMLAGLGQIHLDGHVVLSSVSDRVILSDFMIAKTFAWGGVYGATKSIEDIEDVFAQGIADALTGHVDDKKAAQKK